MGSFAGPRRRTFTGANSSSLASVTCIHQIELRSLRPELALGTSPGRFFGDFGDRPGFTAAGNAGSFSAALAGQPVLYKDFLPSCVVDPQPAAARRTERAVAIPRAISCGATRLFTWILKARCPPLRSCGRGRHRMRRIELAQSFGSLGVDEVMGSRRSKSAVPLRNRSISRSASARA